MTSARPATRTFRTQSEAAPYSSARTRPSRVPNAHTGVEYSRPVTRPRWLTIANGGNLPAISRITGFAILRLNRAKTLGIGTLGHYGEFKCPSMLGPSLPSAS
jgi:hypothetical protein